jgi:tRNA A37 N6-isopentenylltransferase MiaA
MSMLGKAQIERQKMKEVSKYLKSNSEYNQFIENMNIKTKAFWKEQNKK